MIRILKESKQDIEDFKWWCASALKECRFNLTEIDSVLNRYFVIRNSLRTSYPEYVDISKLTKIFKEFIKLKQATDKLDLWDNSDDSLKMRQLRQYIIGFVEVIAGYRTKGEITRSAKSGAKLIGEKDGWKVYYITTVDAAQIMGKGTTWCITGRYEGHEGEAERWFNTYKKRNKVNGYYFFIKDDFDADNPETTCDSKWCLLKSIGIPSDSDVSVIELYNADQSTHGKDVIACEDIIQRYKIPAGLVLDEQWVKDIVIRYQVEYQINQMGEQYLNNYIVEVLEKMFSEDNTIDDLVEQKIITTDGAYCLYSEYLDAVKFDYRENRRYYLDILNNNNIQLTDEEKEDFVNNLPIKLRKLLRVGWQDYLYPLYLTEKGLTDTITFEKWEQSQSPQGMARAAEYYVTNGFLTLMEDEANKKEKKKLTARYLNNIDVIKKALGIED